MSQVVVVVDIDVVALCYRCRHYQHRLGAAAVVVAVDVSLLHLEISETVSLAWILCSLALE